MNVAHSALAVLLLAPSVTSAQSGEWSTIRDPVESPERFTLELRGGPYVPTDSIVDPQSGGARTFDLSFGSDDGPLLGLEFDVHILRIPYLGPIAIGGAFGWVRYSARATAANGSSANITEETSLTLLPLSALGVLRIDVLARELSIPLVFTGKLGYDWIPWTADTGDVTEGEGIAHGFRWAAQAALELDFFEPRAARSMDEEWGINHSVLFFEVYGSYADNTSPPVGDHFTWLLGLGFTI